MPVLQEVWARKVSGSFATERASARELRQEIARGFWEWYSENEDMVLVRRKVLIIPVVVRVRDLHDLFVTLFGLAPAAEGLRSP